MFAAALVLVAGLAIGATSIGGVLVVPVLTTLAEIDPGRAVAAASLGFAFTGAAAWLAGRSDDAAHSGPIGRSLALDGSVLAGAALGALTLAWLPAGLLRTAVGLIALGSGVHALIGRTRARSTALPAPVLALLGGSVGCLSAWSGTGGPVVLLPLLALAGMPPAGAVDAAQRVQLPVALAATAVNFAAGRLDWALGTAIGLLVLAGWALGRRIARGLPAQRLRQAVAFALIGAGFAYL